MSIIDSMLAHDKAIILNIKFQQSEGIIFSTILTFTERNPVVISRIRCLCCLLFVISLLFPIITYAEFSLTGVPRVLKGKLVDHLNSTKFSCDAPPSAAKKILKQSDAQLRLGLQSLGYFNAHFERDLTFNKKCWQLNYQIELGDALLIRHADIKITGAAAQNEEFRDLLEKYSMPTDSAFNNDNYEALKLALQARGAQLGYFQAKILEQRVDIYPHKNVADVTLHWDSGSRYRFGHVYIQQTVLKDELFRQLLSVEPGALYNLSTLQNDRIRLNETRYFKLVEITPLLDQQQQTNVPIQVLATAGPPSSYEVGAGFSTDTGPRLRGSYSRHRINDAGHQGEVNLLLSPVLNKLNLNYSMPWRDPRTDSLRADLSYLDEDNDSFKSQRWETSLTESRLLASGWNQSLSLTLSSENSKVGREHESDIHLVPSISWSKLSMDNLSYPSNGYSQVFAVLGSSEQLVSDTSFLQLQSTTKWITTLPYQFRLLMRAELGYTFADNIDDLPTSQRFFTGGDNSIRGYEYQSLGPKRNSKVIGGKHKAVASIELERPVYKKWSIASFIDSGNTWNKSFDPVTGVGLGLRWRSPIGPLRFDIGVPLNDGDHNFRLHFSFGAQL